MVLNTTIKNYKMDKLVSLQKKHRKDQWGILFGLLLEMGKMIKSEETQKQFYDTIWSWYLRDFLYSRPPIIFDFKLERIEYGIQELISDNKKNEEFWKVYKEGIKKLEILE